MREASRKNGSLRNLKNKGPMPRRFPPPWSVEELEACYVVRDHSGQALAYVCPAIGGQIAHEGRGAADCGEYCEFAGAVARGLTKETIWERVC